MLCTPSYVLITPARDEAEFIETTIQSVMRQTVSPLKWIIVSDGSTDGTDEIVQRYASECPWIELIRMPERRERHFAGKVHAFNAGYARVKDLPYEVIGNLDADVSFDENYFLFLLQKLQENPALGVVGSAFRDNSGQGYDYRFVSSEHVTGTCQLFRRSCFEEIGGYVPVKSGAVDAIAVITARMKGWKTRTFVEKVAIHHRSFGTAEHAVLAAKFRLGRKDYSVGNHPLWEAFRTVYQMSKPPRVVGGLMVASGYLWALARRVERPVSAEFIAFHRAEELARLRKRFAIRGSKRDETCNRPPERVAAKAVDLR